MTHKRKMAFEMANADDPLGIATAAQQTILSVMQDIVNGTKKDIGGPGLTWAQIEFLITELKKKKVEIFHQEGAM